MTKGEKAQVRRFVSKKVTDYYTARLDKLDTVELPDLLRRKNIFLLAAEGLTPWELIDELLTARTIASSEGLFGKRFEDVALKVLSVAHDVAIKSSAGSIDAEVISSGRRFIISLKAGPATYNAGNAKNARKEFTAAKARVAQEDINTPVFTMNAAYYGNSKPVLDKIPMVLRGQAFWFFASKEESFYIELLKMCSKKNKTFRAKVKTKFDEVRNRLTGEFLHDFCDSNNSIMWDKLAKLNSGNVDTKEQRDYITRLVT